MTLGILGPIELRLGDAVLSVEGRKPREVLAVLVAARGSAVSEPRLVEALWGQRPPATATTTLHSHVSRVRRAVRPLAIRSSAAGYVIDLDGVRVDAVCFERLLDEARTSTGGTLVDRLEEALGLWRGVAFGDLAELVGVRGEALRLDELRLVATEEWIDARLVSGDDADVVGQLDALLAEHPLRERFWRQMMLALYRCGRQRDALVRADRLRQMLRDQFGLAPSPAVQALEAQILADDPDLLVVRQRPRATASVPGIADATSLIGRDEDVERVLRAISPRVVVTVSGPGGVGKTRVAQKAASFAHEEFSDGVVVVELAAVREPSGVVGVVGRALDVQQRQHRTLEDSVVEFLVPKRLLLVLDNCEHMINQVASLVDRVRQRCAGVGILTTSRSPLGLPDEHVHVLVPLATPARDADPGSITDAPAGRLFADRAAMASPGFTIDARNARAVAEICHRLDGLPLALELAAARVRTMGPDALAARLDQRFALLAGERRGVDERHHTLRGVVEWSYDLLEPVEQEVFDQLSVFAGSFDLPAAEVVCRVGDGEPTIGPIVNLVDKSMVRLDAPGDARYALLETMREFGQARLRNAGRLTEVEQRHRSCYLQLAVEAAAGVDTVEESSWIQRLDDEFDNIRTAHTSAVAAGDVDVAGGLVVALREYAFRSIRYEVAGFAETTMSMDGFGRCRDAPVVAGVAAYGRWVRGDLESAIELAIGALEMQDRTDRVPTGLVERVLANARFYQGRIDEALHWIDRMVEVARISGSPPQLAHAMYMCSVARTSVGRPDLGIAVAEESAAVARATGSPTAHAQAAYARGVALRSTDIAESGIHLRRSAELAERARNRWIRAFALTEVHWIDARLGDVNGGLAGFADVIDTWYRGGDWANLWLSLRHVFVILTQLERHASAAVVHGALVAAGAAYALPFEPGDADRLEHQVELLRGVLGPSSFANAVRRGTAMGESEVVAFVQSAISTST